MKNLLFFALIISLLVVACASDDSVEMDEAIMEVDKNSMSFVVTTFNNTLREEVQDDQKGRRLDLRVNVDGGTLILSVSNWDWQNPPVDGILEKTYDTNSPDEGSNSACMETNNITYCDGGLGTYLITNVNYVSEGIDDEGEGEIIISENDASNKTVSGSFDLIVRDIFTEEKINFKGIFDNLPYTVL